MLRQLCYGLKFRGLNRKAVCCLCGLEMPPVMLELSKLKSGAPLLAEEKTRSASWSAGKEGEAMRSFAQLRSMFLFSCFFANIMKINVFNH